MYKTPEFSPFLTKFVNPKKPYTILLITNIINSIYTGPVIIDFTSKWVRNYLAFDHLSTNAVVGAAFYSLISIF